MDPDLKKGIKDKIMEKADLFKLHDIIQHSFVRQYDGKTQISSQDMAYSISSLLEHPNITGEVAAVENKNPNAFGQ